MACQCEQRHQQRRPVDPEIAVQGRAATPLLTDYQESASSGVSGWCRNGNQAAKHTAAAGGRYQRTLPPQLDREPAVAVGSDAAAGGRVALGLSTL